MAASSKAASKDPEALKRELWGWYAYDFANSAFFQSAGTVRTSPFFFCLRFLEKHVSHEQGPYGSYGHENSKELHRIAPHV